MRAVLGTFAVDLSLVLLFAVVGRLSHEEGVTLGGVVVTALPFVIGLGLGWLAVRWLRHAWPLKPVPAVPVWVATVVVGLTLRVVSGTGEAPLGFVLVATVVLGAFLLGWRSVVAIVVFAGGGLQRWAAEMGRRSGG